MPALPPATICAKSKDRMLKTFGWGESGCIKINTYVQELTRANRKRKRGITEIPQAFPTILELAILSQHAYTISDLKEEAEVPFKLDEMSDWVCIGTGRYSDGYCGAAYVNHKHSHVVTAHGGTEFNIKKPMELYRDVILTDVGGVFINREVSQISSAYVFTKIIVNLCSDTQFSISVTGHSLGGWLAQICAFYIEHPIYISRNERVKTNIEDKQKNLGIRDYVEINKPYHVHTVSFDSPGCRKALKKIVGYYGSKLIEWRENVDTLDFTVIIAPSNSVNTCGEHVGYVLKLDMDDVQDISWATASHGIKLFVDHLSSRNPSLREVHDVYWRKAVQSADECIILDKWYLGRRHSCQVSILSPMELEFLTRAKLILKWRREESLEMSEGRIFRDKKHKGAREILDSIKIKSLNDFVLNFTVTHNVIESPENNPNNHDMSELMSKLIMLLRVKRIWLNGSEFQDVIRDLPGCRQMVCENEGSLFVKRFPKLNDRKCTTGKLCDQVRAFLGNGLEHFLHINAGTDCRQSRLYMVHIFNCFRDYYKVRFGEHVLFINISIVQSLSAAINMAIIFRHTKYKLIVVEHDSEINVSTNEIIADMIENVKSEKKKLIIVTSGDNCLALKNHAPLNCDVDLTLQFENLDGGSKQFISDCQVDMHGNIIMLGKSDPSQGQYLLDDIGRFFKFVSDKIGSRIICDIFDGKIIDLSGRGVPQMAEHYIPRTLFQITLDVEKLKGKVNEFCDILVVSNSDMSLKNLIPDVLFEKNLIHEADSNYTKARFLKDCQSIFISRNVHWFKHESSMFVWQISNRQPCFEYLKSDDGDIPELGMLESQNNFVILADEPGMGKSAAIVKLYLEYTYRQFDSTNSQYEWPVYINLNVYQVELKDTAHSYDSAMSFLTRALNLDRKSGFEKSLFKFCLEKIGNLIFFIDSFDEISEKGQDFVVRMLEGVKNMEHSRIRVWIATRDYAKLELEKRLETKAYRFHRVKGKAQIKFLVNYWTHNVPGELRNNNSTEREVGNFFAKRVLTEIRKVLGNDHTFIGIPLQLVLLATIYNDKFLQLLETKVRDYIEGVASSLSYNDEMSCDKFSSTLELYALFVRKKVNIWLDEKFKFDTRTDWMEDTLRARMYKIHSHAAFLYVSSSVLTNSDINIESLSPADSEEVNRVGFCERIMGWEKTMSMPLDVFKRIGKAQNEQESTSEREPADQCLDTVLLSTKKILTKRGTFQCDLKAEIICGTESDLSELTKRKSSGQIHWFKEIDGSDLVWQYSCPALPETSYTESVEIKISESNFQFYHQTIAEYFTAKYLVNLIRKNHKNNVVSFLIKHYHQPYFKKIRYFLDSILCTDIPVLKNLELFDTKNSSSKIESLRNCLSVGMYGVDALERNLLHYALAYGDHGDGLFWMIAKNLNLFHKKDLLGETCLSYLCLSEHFTHLSFVMKIFKREVNKIESRRHENFDTSKEDLVNKIMEVPVLYTIFCGSDFQTWLNVYARNAITPFWEQKMKPVFTGINYEKFIEFIMTTDLNLLIKNVEINMTWLTHCAMNKLTRIKNFLSRLCLHNSLDKNYGILFLDDWFKICLSDDGGEGSHKLGAELISACRDIKEWDEHIFSILRNNLPNYYHNVFPYLASEDEYDLWKSCLDLKDKRQMLFVMKNHNFYSLLRGKQDTSSPLCEKMINFVYHESNGEFKDALNEGLAKAFHVYIFADFLDSAFKIYCESDLQTKKRMIKDNFVFLTNNTIHGNPELSLESAQTLKNIIDGKDTLWTLRPLQKIKEKDFQSEFFTLPVSAEYQDCH